MKERQQPDGVRDTLTKEEYKANLKIIYGEELGEKVFSADESVWEKYDQIYYGGHK